MATRSQDGRDARTAYGRSEKGSRDAVYGRHPLKPREYGTDSPVYGCLRDLLLLLLVFGKLIGRLLVVFGKLMVVLLPDDRLCSTAATAIVDVMRPTRGGSIYSCSPVRNVIADGCCGGRRLRNRRV